MTKRKLAGSSTSSQSVWCQPPLTPLAVSWVTSVTTSLKHIWGERRKLVMNERRGKVLVLQPA